MLMLKMHVFSSQAGGSSSTQQHKRKYRILSILI